MRSLGLGSFAMVMATGIVSVDMRGRAPAWVSITLLWLAVAGYAVLVARSGSRLVADAGALRDELSDPARAFGAFAFVAATGVLGVRIGLAGQPRGALTALVVATAALLMLGIGVWRSLPRRDAVTVRADGTWFLCAVACQSVAVLAATEEPATGGPILTPVAVGCWLAGAVLYVAVLVRVAARLRRHGVRPAEFHPPYWVAMGATAITVLAGARIMSMRETPAFAVVRGVVDGVSVSFWVLGSALFAVLVVAMWWRHVVHRVPLRYEPAWWSAVFPLGMYGAASLGLGTAAELPFPRAVGGGEIWLGLAAWLVVFAAMLGHLARAGSHRTGR